MGSVSPLLAVARLFQRDQVVWVGTRKGPERAAVDDAEIPFYSLPAGKLRRYASFKNITDIGVTAWGFAQAVRLLRRVQPGAVVGAGSFVQVPLMAAARMMGIPLVVHQLDIRMGLANRMCMPYAERATFSFPPSFRSAELLSRWKIHAEVVGTPVRPEIENCISQQEAREVLGISSEKKVALAVGGGAGSRMMNRLVASILPFLPPEVFLLHVTGKGKEGAGNNRNYRAHSFLGAKEMMHAYCAADVVVSRAGIGTLAELSALKKPAIVIPLETGNTQQWENAAYFQEREAVEVVRERDLFEGEHVASGTGERFAEILCELLQDGARQRNLSVRIGNLHVPRANERIAEAIRAVLALEE